jgi:succinyl-CoA synthetase beta subunit
VLNEWDSMQLLASHGLAIPTQSRLAPDGSGARDGIQYPAAAKVLAKDLPHKSDAGGVRLNLRNARELDAAIERLLADVRRAAPAAHIEGIVVSPMVDDALEVIVGVINDSVFGPTVLLGCGGTLAEVLSDRSYRVAPFDEETADAMIHELRGAAMFSGVRGAPARDTPALATAISRVSHMAWALRDRLLELDINPLFVRVAGQGVIAGDALAVMVDSA